MKFLSIACLFPALAFASAGFEAKCPDQIQTKQAAVNTPAGWKGYENNLGGFPLAEVHLMDGPIEEHAYVKPDALKSKTKGKSRYSWTFTKDSKMTVACKYVSTDVELFMPVPQGATGCILEQEEVPYLHNHSMTCR